MLEKWVDWQIKKSGGLQELIWGYLIGILVSVAAVRVVYIAYKLT